MFMNGTLLTVRTQFRKGKVKLHISNMRKRELRERRFSGLGHGRGEIKGRFIKDHRGRGSLPREFGEADGKLTRPLTK